MEAEDNRPDEIERLEEPYYRWAFLEEPDPPDRNWVQRGELLPNWRRPEYMGRAVAYNDRGPRSWMHHSTPEVYAAMVNLNATKARDIYFNHSHEIWPHLFRTEANPQEGLEVGALTREGYAISQLRWRVTNVSKHVDVGGDRYPAMLGVHVLEPLNSIGHKKVAHDGCYLEFTLGGTFGWCIPSKNHLASVDGHYVMDPQFERLQRMEHVCIQLKPPPGCQIERVSGAGCGIEMVPNLMSIYVATRLPGVELAVIQVKMTRLLNPLDMQRMESLHCGVLTSQLRNAQARDYDSGDSITDVLTDVVRPDEELEEGEVHSAQKPPSRPIPKRTRRSLDGI